MFPFNNKVPPVDAEYQSIVSPVPGVAVIVTEPVPQRLLLPAVGATGLLIVAVTAVLVAARQPVVVFLACA